MNLARWHSLMRSMCLPESDDTFDALCAAYKEPHRHYHTGQHIDDSLEQFDRLRVHADRPAAIEIAIWFHDAIYKPYKSENEQKSADWAARFLHDASAEDILIDRVTNLVLATRHEAIAKDSDTAILIDVDLAILGASPDHYNAFEQAIRREYRWVPSFLYQRKRTEILNSFLGRTKIFTTDLFHTQYETRARENIRSAIANLH